MSSSVFTNTFKHIKYLWNNNDITGFEKYPVDLLLYRSNILGADLRITNYGGGNTSVKTVEQDPLTGKDVDVMWIKGSGGDIGTLTRSGLSALYLDRLHSLKQVYKGLEYEDEMVPLFHHCLYDLNSKAPSIDTPLHAFLPFKHIDHVHPDACIAIAAAKDSKKITEELYKGQMGWIPWQRPGFDLGLQLENLVKEQPHIRGIVLENHGIFTWGDTAYDCYHNTLDVIEKASEYLEQNYGKERPVFGGMKVDKQEPHKRKDQAAKIAPVLRGFCSGNNKMVGHFTDDEQVLEFINSNDLEKLAPMGTSCPDHFLRTKIKPMILDLPANADLDDVSALKAILQPQFDAYRKDYETYYNNHKHPDSPPMRDHNPVVILWPGVGMFTFSKDKKNARIAAEFYQNAINVMKGAEAVSEYTSLPLREAFDIEYWHLEEAKLKRQPPEKMLSRKIALVTGAGNDIGRAIAEKLAAEGACIVLSDNHEERLQEVVQSMGKDTAGYSVCDLAHSDEIEKTYQNACLTFGGIDIIVNCSGAAITGSLEQDTGKDRDLLNDMVVKGQINNSRHGANILRKQESGGDIINVVGINGIANEYNYESIKAAQLHMSRLLAAEMGNDKIRVNSVNPDFKITGNKVPAPENEFSGNAANEHKNNYDKKSSYYKIKNLLGEMIKPQDVANAVFCFAGDQLSKTTGNVLNVDGGIADAFPR